MKSMQRGFRAKLEDSGFNVNQTVEVRMAMDGYSVYDFCCFGVDINEKLSDDRYMIFYNQVRSPKGEISYEAQSNSDKFAINLAALPNNINKLVFTVSIDGRGTMGEINSHSLQIAQNNTPQLELRFTGADFKQEKAITSIEIYRKGVWRVSAVASGFNGGLDALLSHYGGQATEAPAPSAPAGPRSSSPRPPQAPSVNRTAQPVPDSFVSNQPPAQSSRPAPGPNAGAASDPFVLVGSGNSQASPSGSYGTPGYQSNPPYNPPAFRLQADSYNTPSCSPVVQVNPGHASLETKFQHSAPKLLSLVPHLEAAVNRFQLSGCRAKVCLIMSAAATMTPLYRDDTLADVCKRMLPLAVQFTDNGEMDCWYYSALSKRMDPITMRNYEKAVPGYWPALMGMLGVIGYEPKVMQKVLDEYRYSTTPTLVIMVTNSSTNQAAKVQEIIIDSSRTPVFWQFIGIGGTKYGVLDSVETMAGRESNNASLLPVVDFKRLDTSELYNRILEKFSLWLGEVKAKGILR